MAKHNTINDLFSVTYNSSVITVISNATTTNWFINSYIETPVNMEYRVSRLYPPNTSKHSSKENITRINTQQRKDYSLILNQSKKYSIFHACNYLWSYNIPESNNEYCYKCKVKTPQHIILQQKLLNERIEK